MQLDSLLCETAGLIDTMAPETHVDLVNDHGGAFWIGGGFASSFAPQLKIYINGTWGNVNDRWKRLDKFADFFEGLSFWKKLIAPYSSKLIPLGTAITLKKGRPPSGRIYLSAYGERMSYYEELSKNICGENFQLIVGEFGQIMLAEGLPLSNANGGVFFWFW